MNLDKIVEICFLIGFLSLLLFVVGGIAFVPDADGPFILLIHFCNSSRYSADDFHHRYELRC